MAHEYAHALPPGRLASLSDSYISALLEDGLVDEVSVRMAVPFHLLPMLF